MKRKAEDTKKSKVTWTDEEDDALLKAVVEDKQNREAEADGDEEEEEEEDWDDIAKAVPGKTPVQCYKRYIQKFKNAPTTRIKPESAARPSEGEGKDGDDEEEEDDEDDDDVDENGEPKKGKRVKKEGSGWGADEVELLKKLVEQYKDSKFGARVRLLD